MSIHGAQPSTSSPRAARPGAVAPGASALHATADRSVPAVSVRGLTKTYRAGIIGCSARVEALRGADLDIEAGAVLGIVGPPGAGKSTLMLCMAGLLRPDAGSIVWFGRTADVAGRPPRIVYVPERAIHYGFMTVREAVEYHAILRDGAGKAGETEITEALASTDLLDLAAVRIADVPWSAGPLLSIAQALVGEPRIVLLDETLCGLQASSRRRIIERLHELAASGVTIVAAARTAAVLDGLTSRILVVVDGRVSGPVDLSVLQGPSLLELIVATPGRAAAERGSRVAEGVRDRQVVRIPLDGTTAEAVLARCRACGIQVEASRVVPAGRCAELADRPNIAGASTREDVGHLHLRSPS